MTPPIFSATERQIPPRWAIEQRELIDLMNRTAPFFAERYTRPDGTLKWRKKWSGMDGTDNGYEVFIPYPLFYLLGGGDSVAVTLVNTDPVESRRVVVQSGMFGEHAFTGTEEDKGARMAVEGKWIEVHLGPCTHIQLQMGLKRFAHRPAYGHPVFA